MAPKTNLLSHRTKPETPGLMKLEVLRSTHVTPNMMRVTLGGRDITQFVPLGFDQWFRLIIPKTPAGIDKLPTKLTMRTYFQMQVRSEAERPVVRNYTTHTPCPCGQPMPPRKPSKLTERRRISLSLASRASRQTRAGTL